VKKRGLNLINGKNFDSCNKTVLFGEIRLIILFILIAPTAAKEVTTARKMATVASTKIGLVTSKAEVREMPASIPTTVQGMYLFDSLPCFLSLTDKFPSAIHCLTRQPK
jgi:hypothetical protein